MKSLLLLAVVLAVGAAEARVTVYRNQDVLVKSLTSPELARALEAPVSYSGESIRVGNGNLVEATVDTVAVGNGATSYEQKLVYAVRAGSGRTYECSVAVKNLYEVKTSPQGITYSTLSDPRATTPRCR